MARYKPIGILGHRNDNSQSRTGVGASLYTQAKTECDWVHVRLPTVLLCCHRIARFGHKPSNRLAVAASAIASCYQPLREFKTLLEPKERFVSHSLGLLARTLHNCSSACRQLPNEHNNIHFSRFLQENRSEMFLGRGAAAFFANPPPRGRGGLGKPLSYRQ